jgi:hypothetical protein
VEIKSTALLSAWLTSAYARKTPKTLTRDINAIIKLGLIERSGNHIRAKRELIFGLLPTRKLTKIVPSLPAPPPAPQSDSSTSTLAQQILP